MKGLIFLVLAAIVLVCSAQPNQVRQSADQIANDLRTLNYALTLEHLEATYYRQGLERFNDTDFVDAGYPASVRSYISLIAFHEASHVDLLTGAIEGSGGNAVGECVYDFTAAFTSVPNFLATARLLEATGTSAYDGAANTINNAVYLQVAAQIATVEARHTAYLNSLNNVSAFPDSFEPTLTPEQVVAAAAGFFISCPNNISLPTFAYTFVPLSSNFTYQNRSGQPETQEQIDNDNEVLNYALTLELFGANFYGQAANFSQQDFTDAGFEDAYLPFQMIIEHERAHLAFLRQTLSSRGAAVAEPCTYNVGNALDSVVNALNFARVLENLEVTAYDGAINRITDFQLIQGAATIATVEARHAQYLNNYLLNIAVNNESLDAANEPEAILNITAPFFGADCAQPAIPVYAYTLQAFSDQAIEASPSQSGSSSSSFSSSNSKTSCPSVTNTATASPVVASLSATASSNPTTTVQGILPSNSPTSTSSLSATSTASVSATSTASVSSTSAASVSATSTASVSATSTASVSSTSAASVSATSTASVSGTSTASVSSTSAASVSATSTASVSGTSAASVSSTSAASVSSTSGASVSSTSTASTSASSSSQPSTTSRGILPSESATTSSSATSSASGSVSQSSVASVSATASASASSSASGSVSQSSAASVSASSAASQSASASSSSSASQSASASSSSSASVSVSVSASNTARAVLPSVSSSGSSSSSASASVAVSASSSALPVQPSYCPSQSPAQPSYCPSASASPVPVCVATPSPSPDCDCCEELRSNNQDILSRLQTIDGKIASALRKVAALDAIEEELSDLSGVNNKLNRILAEVDELNGGNTNGNTQSKRSVEEQVVYVRSFEESSAGRSGNWVNGLF